MKVFGSVYPFVESEEASLRLGRYVANYEFLRALLCYGSFDEYHLFCLSAGHFRRTAEKIRGDRTIPDERKARVKLFLHTFLIDRLRTTDYHVFHLGGWGYFFPGLVYLRNRHAVRKFPITGLTHSLNGVETNHHALKMCVAPLLPCDTVICSSVAGRMVLEKTFARLAIDLAPSGADLKFGGRLEVIPLGVGEHFFANFDKGKCRARLDLPPDAFVLLSVGRLSPQTKADPYPVLQCIRRLRDRRPDRKLFLVLAGGVAPGTVDMVERMVGELDLRSEVRIIANFGDADKEALYGAADVYLGLIDNLQETFGISVVEAMAAGLPVVVSDLDGYKELVDQGIQGFKVPTYWTDELGVSEFSDMMDFDTMQLILAQSIAVDTEKCVESLDVLWEDEGLRRSMGEAGRDRVRSRYVWSRIIGQYEALWGRLQAKAQSAGAGVRPLENPFRNDYEGAFSHYPTGLVRESWVCTVTAAGVEARARGRLPTAYTDVDPLLDKELALAALEALARGPLAVAHLCRLCPHNGPRDRGLYTLLWMAKYSLIRFQAA